MERMLASPLARVARVVILIVLSTILLEQADARSIAADEATASDRQVLPGLIPAPAVLPGGIRWQIITTLPRGVISAFDLSPDGKWAAIADGAMVRICSTDGFVLRHVLLGHEDRIRSVAWSPDGTKIATASADRTARIWQVDGKPLAVLRGHEDTVRGVAWSRDGKRLASSGRDATVRLWNVDGTAGAVIRGSDAPINCVAWSPDGTRIVAGDDDRIVWIWKVEGTRVARCEGHDGAILSLDWSPDGKFIASGCQGYVPRDGQQDPIASVRIWDADGHFIRSLDGHKGHVDCVRFSPDGSRIVTTSEDQRIRVWTTTDGLLAATVRGESEVTLRWAPDGTRLYAASSNRIFRVGPLKDPASMPRAENEVVIEFPIRFERAIWRPGDSSFAVLGMDSQLSLFDAAGRTIWTASTEMQPYGNKDISWRPDGKELLAVGYGMGAPLYDATGKVDRRLSPPETLRFAQWSPDGKSILGFSFNRVYVISSDGKQSRTFRGHRERIESMAWSPDCKRFATGSCDSTVRIWDVDGNGVKVLEGNSGDVDSLAWSPNGQWIATGMDDGTWRLWKPDGSEGPVQAGHSEIMSVTFRPDSQRVATGCWDGTLRLWNVAGGEPIGTLLGHQGPIVGLSWSADGKRLLSAGRDRTVRIWNAEAQRCETVILKLTDGTTATFSAAGDLVDGRPESLDKELRYAVERGSGKIEILTPEQFKELRARSQAAPRPHFPARAS